MAAQAATQAKCKFRDHRPTQARLKSREERPIEFNSRLAWVAAFAAMTVGLSANRDRASVLLPRFPIYVRPSEKTEEREI
jgi:hypothetical protein